MAPSWMEISVLEATSPVNPNAWPAKIRWPVEDTGRNSVSPSTMPRITARVGPHSFIGRPWSVKGAGGARRSLAYSQSAGDPSSERRKREPAAVPNGIDNRCCIDKGWGLAYTEDDI